MARRNAVRAGMIDQRSRATTRRRDAGSRKRKPGINADLDRLRAAIAEYIEPLDGDADALESLDWRRFLSAVDGIDITPAEKLRQLAIALEDEVPHIPGPRGWLILARLYDAAESLDPEDDAVVGSAGLSALSCAFDQAPAVRDRLLSIARDRGRRAVARAPDCATHHYLLGRVAYDSDHLEDALAHFETALAVDDAYIWAQLFRAHALHDLGRYAAAADAYAAVDLSQLVEARAWRVETVRDDHALCLYRAGREAAAVEMWLDAIARIGRRPPDPYGYLPSHLVAAARGPLRDRLLAPLRSAAERVGDDELLAALTAPA